MTERAWFVAQASSLQPMQPGMAALHSESPSVGRCTQDLSVGSRDSTSSFGIWSLAFGIWDFASGSSLLSIDVRWGNDSPWIEWTRLQPRGSQNHDHFCWTNRLGASPCRRISQWLHRDRLAGRGRPFACLVWLHCCVEARAGHTVGCSGSTGRADTAPIGGCAKDAVAAGSATAGLRNQDPC